MMEAIKVQKQGGIKWQMEYHNCYSMSIEVQGDQSDQQSMLNNILMTITARLWSEINQPHVT